MLKLAKKNLSKVMVFLMISLVLANILLGMRPAMAQEDGSILNFSYSLSNGIGGDYKEEIFKILNPEVMSWEKSGLKRKYLPENEEREVAYMTKIVFTAYNSEVGQCDSTPCITANGFDVCKHDKEDTIAMNGIKFGTKIRIPELFGDRVFVVRDRMNARYGSNRADIWMKDKKDAKQFGVQVARVEVLK